MSEGIDKAIEYLMLCTMEDVMDMAMDIAELCDVEGEYQTRETLATLIGLMKENIGRDFEKGGASGADD